MNDCKHKRTLGMTKDNRVCLCLVCGKGTYKYMDGDVDFMHSEVWIRIAKADILWEYKYGASKLPTSL